MKQQATSQQYNNQTFANMSNEDDTIDQHTNPWDTNDLILYQFSLDSKILTHFGHTPTKHPFVFWQQWLNTPEMTRRHGHPRLTNSRKNHCGHKPGITKPTNSKWTPHTSEGNHTLWGPHPQVNKQAINKQTTPHTSRHTTPSILYKYKSSH